MEEMEKFTNKLFSFVEDYRVGAKIKVVGVGGGGCNAVNRMIQSKVEGIEFIVANTDMQALDKCLAPVKLQIGARLTKGLGAGANPEIGRAAALEDTDRIIECLEGADMVFITAGIGGGTGTGAAPIIASLASELGALTIAVVTKPFAFEGKRRMSRRKWGLKDLKECVDTFITIPNDRLLQALDLRTPLNQAFNVCDDVLRQAIQGISDLIQVPGVINLDFADVRTIMESMGVALMGIGLGEGEGRAAEAARRAISNPLLEDSNIQGAKGIIWNITGSSDMTMMDVQEAAAIIQDAADASANIIFGAVTDEDLGDKVKITIIATGFEPQAGKQVDRNTHAAETAAPVAKASPAAETEEPMVFSEVRYQTALDMDNRNLEIPAYLRRKAL